MKKNFLNFAMVALVAIGSAAYTGCGKKGCTTEADDKYDASATESDPQACSPSATVGKFVAQYNVTENCGTTPDTYQIAIAASSSNEYGITISNLFDAGVVTSATVNKSNLTIDSQTFGTQYSISGSGNLATSTITINFTITGGATPYSCSITGNKL